MSFARGNITVPDIRKNLMGNRDHTIDVIKGICIIFVIITHMGFSDSQRMSLLFPFWIDTAVPVFMVISGYLYAGSLDRDDAGDLRHFYTRRYLLKNFLRFTVPFAVMYIVEISTVMANGQRSFSEIFLTSYGYKLFLTGGFGPGSYYYPVMMQYILIFPVIYYVVKHNILGGIRLCFAVNMLFEIFVWVSGLDPELYRLLIFRYVFIISVGVHHRFHHVDIRDMRIRISLMIGMIYILIAYYAGVSPFVRYWRTTSYLAALYGGVIAIVFMGTNMRFRPLESIGRASFDIFLVQAYYYAFWHEIISRRMNVWIVPFFDLVICISGGLLFYEFESRLTRKIKTVLKVV